MRQEMTSTASGSGDLTTCSLCGAEISNGKCTKCGDTYPSHTADGRSTKTKPLEAAEEYEEKSRRNEGDKERKKRQRQLLSLLRKPPFKPADNDPPYVKERLGPFIDFFDKAYYKDRRNESMLLYPIVIFGSLIAVVNVFSVGVEVIPLWVAIISSILGALISILTGINQFEKYHQRWLHSKQVSAKLRNQYYLWKYRVGDYACKPRDNPASENPNCKLDKLVSSCEEIILKEAAEYADMFTEQRPGSGNGNNSQGK